MRELATPPKIDAATDTLDRVLGQLAESDDAIVAAWAERLIDGESVDSES